MHRSFPDRLAAIKTADRSATRAGLTLVAGIDVARAVAEIGAPRPLEQVAADGSHVAELLRRGFPEALGKHRIVTAHHCVFRDVRHHRARPEEQAIALRVYPVGVFDGGDIHQMHRPFDAELHQVIERRAARDVAGVGAGTRKGSDCLPSGSGAQ